MKTKPKIEYPPKPNYELIKTPPIVDSYPGNISMTRAINIATEAGDHNGNTPIDYTSAILTMDSLCENYSFLCTELFKIQIIYSVAIHIDQEQSENNLGYAYTPSHRYKIYIFPKIGSECGEMYVKYVSIKHKNILMNDIQSIHEHLPKHIKRALIKLKARKYHQEYRKLNPKEPPKKPRRFSI